MSLLNWFIGRKKEEETSEDSVKELNVNSLSVAQEEPVISTEGLSKVELLNNFEKKIKREKIHTFKIKKIVKKGFVVELDGLSAFVSFSHMPWQYGNNMIWRLIAPNLYEQEMKGKVFLFEKEKSYLILDANIPQFTPPHLEEDKKYHGLIIAKKEYGVFVDVGYAFNWKYGSLLGLVHSSNFKESSDFKGKRVGEELEVIFWGYNKEQKVMFGLYPEFKEWVTEDIQSLVGKTFPVNIVETKGGKTKALVNNKYEARFSFDVKTRNLKRDTLYGAVRNLTAGAVLHCEICGYNYRTKLLYLEWKDLVEIAAWAPAENEENKSIRNRISEVSKEKLNLIGKEVKVEVRTKKNKADQWQKTYLVEDKHKGILSISCSSYALNRKERNKIEQNLPVGEVLECKVIKVNKKSIAVRWMITDEELAEFLWS